MSVLMMPAITRENEFVWFCVAFQKSTPDERESFVKLARSMPYEEFLTSPYWRIVRRQVYRERGVACERCRSFGTQLHHETYEHHGEEHLYLEDLEILCRSCHEKQHGIETRQPSLEVSEFYRRVERELHRRGLDRPECALCDDTGWRAGTQVGNFGIEYDCARKCRCGAWSKPFDERGYRLIMRFIEGITPANLTARLASADIARAAAEYRAGKLEEGR